MGIAERWKRFAPLPPETESRLERLGPLFEREGVLLAYLFGSLGQGKQGDDVDLAVLVQNTPSTEPSDGAAFRLREPICELLGTERVDLVDLMLHLCSALRSCAPVVSCTWRTQRYRSVSNRVFPRFAQEVLTWLGALEP